MPKHPPYPPFSTKIIKSGGKKTPKYIITVPKPVVNSQWEDWKISKIEHKLFKWIPDGMEPIIKHLLGQIPKILSDLMSSSINQIMKTDRFIQYFVVKFDNYKTLRDNQSWSLNLKSVNLNKIENSLNSGLIDPNDSFYVLSGGSNQIIIDILLQHNNSTEDIAIVGSLEDQIEKGVGAILLVANQMV